MIRKYFLFGIFFASRDGRLVCKNNILNNPRTKQPDGSSAQAFTQGRGWYAVVTDADEILIFDQLTGELRQTVAIE